MENVSTSTASWQQPARFRAYAGVALASLVAIAAPGVLFSGHAGPFLAWVLAFVPGAIIVPMIPMFHDSKSAMGFVVLSTGLRMVLAGAGALAVLWIWPAIPRQPFLLFLAPMYLIALAVEVYLTLAKAPVREGLQLLLYGKSSRLKEVGR
jgi:hypothetical protein